MQQPPTRKEKWNLNKFAIHGISKLVVVNLTTTSSVLSSPALKGKKSCCTIVSPTTGKKGDEIPH
jgi:hypothetical protein